MEHDEIIEALVEALEAAKSHIGVGHGSRRQVLTQIDEALKILEDLEE